MTLTGGKTFEILMPYQQWARFYAKSGQNSWYWACSTCHGPSLFIYTLDAYLQWECSPCFQPPILTLTFDCFLMTDTSCWRTGALPPWMFLQNLMMFFTIHKPLLMTKMW